MKEFSYVITDSEGIHARPTELDLKLGAKSHSDIKLKKGEKEADAKRIFGVMGLAVKCGEEIVMTAEGADEAEAIAAIETFLKENL